MTQQEKLKQEILQKTKEYYELVHKPVQEKYRGRKNYQSFT